jgi:hypothetical protein
MQAAGVIEQNDNFVVFFFLGRFFKIIEKNEMSHLFESQNLRVSCQSLQFGDDAEFTGVKSVSEDRLCDRHKLFIEAHLLDSWENVGRLKRRQESKHRKE